MIGRVDTPQGRRVRACALGTSALALAILLTGTAYAQCAPDPTVAGGITTCTGTDADGLTITTSGTRVVVDPTATVLGSNAPAIAVRIASPVYYANTTIAVAGRVDGGSQTGIDFLTQAVPGFSYSSQGLAVTVQAGGVVTGATGITIGRGTDSYSNVTAAIDNAGTITGTNGFALLSEASSAIGFPSIINRQGGFIGAIRASVGTVTNAGTIDGGALGAINWGTNGRFFYTTIDNSGAILSSGATATLESLSSSFTITNSGVIANSGTGAAIDGTDISIVNSANGRISSGGTTAIRAGNAVRITNAGTIDGDIVAGGTGIYAPASTLDTAAGRVNGSVLFGAGADTLIAGYDNGALVTGVTGTIDGGTGDDLVRVRFTRDTTLSSPLVLPVNFDRFSLAPIADVTMTLANGFTNFQSLPTLVIGGGGTVVNATQLALAAGASIRTEYAFDNSVPSFVNDGNIFAFANTVGTAAVRIDTGNFTNNGIIAAGGDGISFSSYGKLLNTGRIVVTGTGMAVFSSRFANSGSIRSTEGIGVIARGSSGESWTNSGTIEGAVAGVLGSMALINTGTVTSSGTGVMLDGYGTLDNRVGGVVTGGTVAVGPQTAGSGLYAATVVNAGTINGTVILDQRSNDSYNGNRYFALPGGILNGDLSLANGGTLITDLANAGTGRFAGITGTVSGANATLRYQVRNDAGTTIAAPAPFTSVGYDLYDGATLTLTGPATTVPLVLAGRGTVDLTADITTSTQSAILVGTVQQPGYDSTFVNALAITSRGTLTLTHDDQSTYPNAAVRLGSADSFTNAGTIVASERVTAYSSIAAIAGGQEIANSGTILLDGAVGVRSARRLVNSGTITQAAGGRNAIGVSDVATLVNSGTIDVGGEAVQATSGGTVENSGRIASSGAAAITGARSVTNLAGGTIAGGAGQPALLLSGGVVTNSGTITGSVDLGYSYYGPTYATGVYIADGGTIAGDLRFGRGDDMLITFGAPFGVSGTIDAGEGTDTLIQARRASDTITLGAALPATFEREGVRAVGADTVVTIRADAPLARAITVAGDGAIVNTADLSSDVRIGETTYFYGSQPTQTGRTDQLAAFTNLATITGGVSGGVRDFTNGGTIGTTALAAAAVSLHGYSDADLTTLAFANDGMIANNGGQTTAWIGGANTVAIANTGTISGGGLSANASPYLPPYFYNYGSTSTVTPTVTMFNSGTVTTDLQGLISVGLSTDTVDSQTGTLALDNSGTIVAAGRGSVAVSFGAGGYYSSRTAAAEPTMTIVNSGVIRANGGGISVEEYVPYFYEQPSDPTSRFASAITLFDTATNSATITNTANGVIEATGTLSSAILVTGMALNLDNAGTISGGAGTQLVERDRLAENLGSTRLAGAIHAANILNDRIVNTGTIIGSIDLGGGDDRIDNLGRIDGNVFLGAGDDIFLQRASTLLAGTVDGGTGDDGLIVDATEGGAINGDQFVNFERFSQVGTGTVAYSGTFRFDSIGQAGGTVTVAAGQTLSSAGPVTIAGSDAAETVINDGTIAGSVVLAGGDDRVVNRGAILGSVALGDGDDVFTDGAGSSVAGGVDGGSGRNRYIVTLAGDRTGIGARSGFNTLAIDGTGTLALTLDQRFDAVALTGTGLTLALNGYTLGSVTGSDGNESLAADGDLASVALGGGNDALALATTRAVGRYDGGAGTDTLRFTAAAPVTLAGIATGFEQVVLSGADLTVTGTLGTTSAPLAFGDGAQRLTVADGGTLAGAIDLGAGDDTLALAGNALLAGTVAGGAGNDTLRFLATGPAILAGTATGFEQLALTGSALTVTGTLGATGDTLAFGDGAQQLTIADGGTLAGTVALGAGDDTLRLGAIALLAGTVSGGAGTDSATVMLAGGHTLATGILRDFETLATEGTGTLTLTGAHAYDRVIASNNLTLAADGVLTAPQVRFGTGDDRFVIAGRFTGAVDGGAGTDSIAVSGGTATDPVAFTTIANVESFGQTAGQATLSGAATFASVDLAGGRLIGLAGSTLAAPQITVRQGATFGSAGTVTGTIAVAGTLSPGASPGTMTVNGNVALAATSVTLFELTPTVSDQLRVNGAVAITSGATLRIVQDGTLRPGTSYDLIVASGGITGSFTTVAKPDTLFGFVVQRADRIQLLGQFLTDTGFSPQVARSVAYANATLAVQPATSSLFAALPALLTGSGASNPRAFAQLTPEAYASASQIGTDNALALSTAARGPGFAPTRTDAGLFTFAQTVGQWHRLGDDAAEGTSAARTRSYGFLGGLGYGDTNGSIGAFGGYLNSRQTIGALGSQTKVDGFVAGVHGRYTQGGFGLTASLLYDGGDADTVRALPGAGTATGRYDLHSWVGDLSVGYDVAVGADWALRPKVGITYLRTTRAGQVESGGAFALTVARDRHVAGFADATLGFGRSDTSPAAFRPSVSFGTRYQIEGRRADALAGYADGGLGLTALGASRARMVGTAAASLSYRFTTGLDLFTTASAQTGRDDHQETVSAGVRLRF